MKPNIYYQNFELGVIEQREMTEEEYAELLASGWTEEGTSDLAD